MILHLIRHGQSTWNVQGRLQGQKVAVPLTRLGRQQAASVARRLSQHRLAGVWSSDQMRARETADVIAGSHGLEVTPTPLLRERGLGELEGTLVADLSVPPEAGEAHDEEVLRCGGESLHEVRQRLRELFEVLAATFSETDEVVLVSHGDTVRALLALLDGCESREVGWVVVENCQVLTRTLPSGVSDPGC